MDGGPAGAAPGLSLVQEGAPEDKLPPTPPYLFWARKEGVCEKARNAQPALACCWASWLHHLNNLPKDAGSSGYSKAHRAGAARSTSEEVPGDQSGTAPVAPEAMVLICPQNLYVETYSPMQCHLRVGPLGSDEVMMNGTKASRKGWGVGLPAGCFACALLLLFFSIIWSAVLHGANLEANSGPAGTLI